jgi:hypothetical protein
MRTGIVSEVDEALDAEVAALHCSGLVYPPPKLEPERRRHHPNRGVIIAYQSPTLAFPRTLGVAFDVVHSSAVLEHVGPFENQ